MLRYILIYGLIAGVVSGAPLSLFVVSGKADLGVVSMAVGYLFMLIALSAVFVAVKRRRDHDLGGVIRFWPALGLGLVQPAQLSGAHAGRLTSRSRSENSGGGARTRSRRTGLPGS